MVGTGRRYRAEHLHQPGGWLSPGYVEVDERGVIARVDGLPPNGEAGSVESLAGFVIPGMINVHSHAHQRGLGGRAEAGMDATAEESFWTWRNRMYALANRVSPEDLEALAAQAYLEMVKAGFTVAGEFHYLHLDPAGRPYDDPAEMSARILAAAARIGIGLALLLVLYTRAGIGQPPLPKQHRFILDPGQYASLVHDLAARTAGQRLVSVGLAPHSLRAVSADEVMGTIARLTAELPDAPVHMHVAEQDREVVEVLAGLGARPAAWLLDHAPAIDRWTFIHATHTDPAERGGMGHAGVVAGLCPATEAALGDGIFPLGDYTQSGGSWAIGTDSNSRISVAEELRLLAFSQRLANGSLYILSTRGEGGDQPGRQLYDQALAGGARSLRQPVGALAPGKRADWLVLDPADPALVEHGPETVLDGWIFSGTSSAVRDVYIGGQRVVHDGHHREEAAIFARFRAAVARLGVSDRV